MKAPALKPLLDMVRLAQGIVAQALQGRRHADICAMQCIVAAMAAQVSPVWMQRELAQVQVWMAAAGAIDTAQCYAAAQCRRIGLRCWRRDIDLHDRWREQAGHAAGVN